MSVTLYANYHLHHHRIANTYPDVDSFVVTDYTRSPFFAKVLLLGVYLFGYPMYWLSNMPGYMKRLTPWKRVRMNLEIVGWFSLMGYCFYVMPHQVFFFYVLPFVFGAFLASLTSMFEHYEILANKASSRRVDILHERYRARIRLDFRPGENMNPGAGRAR